MSSFRVTMEAILKFFTIFGPLLITLVKGLNSGIIFIVDYFTLRTKRLREVVEHDREVARKVAESQKLKESANVSAFNAVEEDAWRIRYEDILKKIKAEDYAGVLAVIDEYDNEEVDVILFDVSQGAEYRAMKIVRLMKRNKS